MGADVTYARSETYTCDRCANDVTTHVNGSIWQSMLDEDADPLEGWFDIDISEHGDNDTRDRTLHFCPPCAAVIMDAIDSKVGT